MSSSTKADRPPQIILITIDTLRDDHVGARRGNDTLTPSLDRFAQDAVRYTDATVNSTLTRPSHASILTGLYPWGHEIRDQLSVYANGVVTLPGLLRERGFVTGGVVSSSPLKALDSGFEFFQTGLNHTEANRPNLRYKSPDRTTSVAEEWARTHREAPFFLWVHYFPPHGPYDPPPDFITDDQRSDMRLPIASVNYEEGAIPAYQELPGIYDPAVYRSRYAAHLRYVDFHVGVLLSTLKSLGIYERATIVLTSDHGESLGEHDWYFTHGNLVYREQAQVPLIVKLPRNRRAGSEVTSPVESVDIAPTILEILDMVGAMPTDGRSLLGASPVRRLRFTESNNAELAAVMDGPWKFALRSGKRRRVGENHPARALYFLTEDPGERVNLASSKVEVARRLERELLSRFEPPSTEPREVDPDELEQLRSLGYVR